MPRMTQLAEAEVFAAIRDLVAHGEYPTSARLRERLEHRGSPVVLQRFLATWYERFGPELARKADSAPKKGKTTGLEAELRRLTADAVQEVEAAQRARVEALDHREQQLDEREKQLDAREANLLAREGKLDERELAQHELVRTISASSAAATRDKDAALAALAAAEAQVAVHTARISDLERAVAHTETLKRELAAARADILDGQLLQQQIDALQAQLAIAGERDRSQAEELKKLSGVAGELRLAREEIERQRAHAGEQHVLLGQLTEKLESALLGLVTQKTEAAERLDQVRAQLAAADAKNQRDAKDLAYLRDARDIALAEVAALGGRLEAATKAEADTGFAMIQCALDAIREQLGALIGAQIQSDSSPRRGDS